MSARSHFSSRRSNVVARNGMVATSSPLAAQAGLRVLQDGGHAVDAAVAAAAVLAVVEPASTGLGGDMFALTWDAKHGELTCLNGSGRSGAAASTADVRAAGFDAIPNNGPGSAFAVSVPGTVDGWQTLLERHGRMGLDRLLQPAIDYALRGFAVSEIIAAQWQDSEAKLRFRPSGLELLPGGRAPRLGEVVTLPELGRSLQVVAEGGPSAFYHGDIGERLAAFVQTEGGWLTEADLAGHYSDWDQAVGTEYRGVTVWECPPAGQGIAALAALNIVEGFDLAGSGLQSLQTYHLLIEAMRCGFTDALWYVADPRRVDVPVAGLLSKDYAATRRRGIDRHRAAPSVAHGRPVAAGGDTVYISVVDGEGNACSFINSVFNLFGTGLVVPGTGIALQNRGALFSLNPQHPNFLAGGQRPYHTIIPAMATRDDQLWPSFGVMGGFQQPQGHLQVIANMVDFGLNPQQALDAPRFSIRFPDSTDVWLEEDVDPAVAAGLRARGHEVAIVEGRARTAFGGGQVIARDPDTGVLMAGSEPRNDGAAMGW